MSSSERPFGMVRSVCAALICVGLAGTAGCTVTPLYGTGGGVGTPQNSELANVGVVPVNTRQAQQVRNHLIFLLGGGAGEPAVPTYNLELNVSQRTVSAAAVQPASAADREPTAGRVIMTSTYVLTDASSGAALASGKRQSSASFDFPRQEFAKIRAERDAEDRAARELAELIRLAVAQDLLKNR